MKTYQIKKGDIVEINGYEGEDSTTIKQNRAVLNLNPDKLAVMRIIDENTVLVALCKLVPRKTTTAFTTNVGEIYVHTKCFYVVDLHQLRPCGMSFLNSYETASRIYDLHNKWVENSKKRREAQKALERKRQAEMKYKRAIQKEINKKKREVEMQYALAYDVAIMNNDKEQMARIEKVVGHPPCQSSKGYTSPSRKPSNKSFNPKPLSGGRFSPK